MVQIDMPAVLAALEWRHLWWVIVASFAWSAADVIADVIAKAIVSTMTRILFGR